MMMEALESDQDNMATGGSASGGGGSGSGGEDGDDEGENENEDGDEGDDSINALVDIYMTGLSHIVS